MTKEETKQYFIDLYVAHIKQEDIPEWAECLTIDRDGEVYAYSVIKELYINGFFWDSEIHQKCSSLLSLSSFQPMWKESLIKVEELLSHYLSQQKEESMQDKVEFEAVSGDQSLFELVGAKDDDLFIVRKHESPYTGIFAFKKNYSSSGELLAERKVKERSYIPEVGHTYKLSKEYSDIFTCVFVDNEGDVWSTCDGVMFTHYPQLLSRDTIKFVRVS